MEGYIIDIIIGCAILFLCICAYLLWKCLRNRQSRDSVPYRPSVDPERPPVSAQSSSLRRSYSLQSAQQPDIERQPTPSSSIRGSISVRTPLPTYASVTPKRPQSDIKKPPVPSFSSTYEPRPPAPCHVFITNESGRAATVEPLDLHGLSVAMAKEQTRQYLKLYGSHVSRLQIITGRGLHSHGGVARIKPAIEDLLIEKGYDYFEINKGGALIVEC